MPARAWLSVGALIAANALLHKPVSDVADFLRWQWGFAVYDRAALVAVPLVSVAVAMAWRRRRGAASWRPAGGIGLLLALLAMTWAAQRWLLVTNVELIHLPQFALIAAILVAAGVPGPAAYLGATAAGIVDETYQHFVLYAGRSDTYYDINDIVLNAIGAAWGVLLAASIAQRTPRPDSAASDAPAGRLHWRGFAAVAALALAWWWDPPAFDPLFRTTIGGHPFYRVLSAPEGLVACGVLAAIVGRAWRRSSPQTPIGAYEVRSAAVSASLLLVVALEGCAMSPRLDPAAYGPLPQPRPLGDSSFITTFWCGPPLALFDDARAAEIAAAGFSVVGPPCEGAITEEGNRQALDVAVRHGLKMWIADPRYSEWAPAHAGWETGVDAAVAAYRDHEALGGYFVADEPSPDKFPAIQAVVRRLRASDPRQTAYINLNPDYVFNSDTRGMYRAYVERFLLDFQPSLLSYDYYPFRVGEDRATFFASLELFRELSERHRVPFMLIVLAMPHGRYRDPTEPELSWQALHALAYGARGISYFAYWTPVDVEYADVFRFRHGLIEDGRPTRHYHEAARLNRRLRTIADELAALRSVSVRDSRGDVAAPLPFGPVVGADGAPVTIGFFAGDGTEAALVVNRDYQRAAAVTFRLAPADRRPEWLDEEQGTWARLEADTLRLPPGGGRLLRWRSDARP